MIDPYNWRGRIVLSNMKDVVNALRTRLSGHFDLVRGTVFHKQICLIKGENIKWWFNEDEGKIAITHDYGLDQDGDTVTGDYILNVGGAKVIGDYINFTKDIIYVNSIEIEYYVYIPREEMQLEDISKILRKAQDTYDKTVQYYINTLGKSITHKETQEYAEQLLKASAKEEAVSILIQQIEGDMHD
jgi:hypothetical protein